jgi:hypothetical protein
MSGVSSQASYLRYDGQHWSMTHDAPVAAENRATVRDVDVVPGTRPAGSVGVGILSAAPDRRARLSFIALSANDRHAGAVNTGNNWQFIPR